MESVFHAVVVAALALLLAEQGSAGVTYTSRASHVPRAVRSAEWDDHMIAQHRERRRTTNPGWQCKVDHPTCTLTDLATYAYDELQRRASGLLATPRNQGNCGSCWAFASVHAYTDKLSIRDDQQAMPFSAEYNTRCFSPNGRNGCCGATDMVEAVFFLQERGTVTDTCLPYTLTDYPPEAPTLVRWFFNSDLFTKKFKSRNPLVCPSACTGTGNFNPSANRVASVRLSVTEEQVITRLDAGDTFVAAMHVGPEFQGYRCGVFIGPVINEITRKVNHMIEIVDYSNSSFPGTPYWVAKNSWGTEFGEGGYFRIARGLTQLEHFLSLELGGGTVGGQESDFSSARQASVCAAETVTAPDQDMLIRSAANTAVSEINSGNLIQCRDPSRSATVTLTNIINATQQVIEGYELEIGIEANVEGCSVSEDAIFLLTVDTSLDGSFTLTNYSYDAFSEDGFSGSAITITAYTVVLLMLTSFTIMLLLIG